MNCMFPTSVSPFTSLDLATVICLEPGQLGMKPGARVGQMLNISFDMAAYVRIRFFNSLITGLTELSQEILGSLGNGATLCLRGRTSKDWKAVMRTVDVLVSTPSMLLPHNPADYPNIGWIMVAGEPCPKRACTSLHCLLSHPNDTP